MARIMETWLKNDDKINEILQDFTSISDYSFIRRDRSDGRRGGGVAICYNHKRIQMNMIKLPRTKHEVIAAIGRRRGQKRKNSSSVCLHFHYNFHQSRSCKRTINDFVLAIKNKYQNPYIAVMGDFNSRSFSEATADSPEIRPILTALTRDRSVLDIIGTNFNDLLVDSSDHATIFVTF